MALPGAVEGLVGRSVSEIFGFGVGTALSNALQPESVQLAQESWGATPLLVLPADILAQLVRLGIIDLDTAEDDAKQTGINRERLERMVKSLYQVPGSSEILELARRGELPADDARQALLFGGMDPRYVDEFLGLQTVLLSPEVLAMARQQSFVTEAEQKRRSALQGVDAEDAELLFDVSGEPPGAEFMIELLRRGKVDEARVRQAIVEGRIKLKYVDDVLASQEVPLSPSIAAEAVVRQRHLPKDPHYYARAAGLTPEDFDAWVEMIGRPMAMGYGLTLARRGEFTFAQFKDIIARSDVRTEFAEDLWKLRRVIPPLFQLTRLHDGGKISDELFGKLLADLGYDQELVAALAHAGKSGQTAKTHHLTATQIDELYQSGLETEAWALEQLKTLGYDHDSATWHLSILWAQMLTQAKRAAVNRVHNLYVAWKIDDAAMQADLDAIGIAVGAKEAFIESWTHERVENTPTLTTAEVRQGFHYKRFTYDEAFARLRSLGHSDEDSLTLLWITARGDPRPR
jgi:hypothetical protein